MSVKPRVESKKLIIQGTDLVDWQMIEENELFSHPTDAYVSGRIDTRVAAGLSFTQAGSPACSGREYLSVDQRS
ncbi:Uncharacterized protein HZ326_3643 [Fusarium oxysporum f. sp. albedinis]|nr:Uncharacterized protein HZ326_3643 [Fusarium oxysporum f. sp. albedinis]